MIGDHHGAPSYWQALPAFEGHASWTGMKDVETLLEKLWRDAHYNKIPELSVIARSNLLLRDAG